MLVYTEYYTQKKSRYQITDNDSSY